MNALPPATMITTAAALARHVRAWAGEPLLALDTESNSLYAYREQVCLIQLSTRQADFIIDPLAVEDLGPLGDLLADPRIEKVFHAAEYDVMCLKRDFGFQFDGLFDTMLAARICGSDQLGLANMLEAYFGVRVNKKHQRANWGERPLPPELLRYAQVDTHYLPALRDHWQAQLARMGRLEEAREAFRALRGVPPAGHHFDPEGYWRLAQLQRLSPTQIAILRELYLFREEMAERKNCPPFKVLSDKTLVTLARLSPSRLGDLEGVRGMTAGQVRRYGQGILHAVRCGRSAPPPARPPAPPRPDEDTLTLYEALRHWRKERARQRGVESGVIVPREALWELARRAPTSPHELEQVPGLGPWKVQAYGEEILAVVARVNGRRSHHRQ